MFAAGSRWLAPFFDINPTDVLDIVVVTAFVYTLMALLRQTRAAFVAIGILILSVVYIAARALGLQLTAWMLQGFFAIFVVIVVVIFQEELRQLFERIAVRSLRRGRPIVSASDPAAIVARFLTDCARDRIGALILLPGQQPVQRHLQGGIPLNGQLSVPLLKSLFDPHSPGHDGAVIVENDRITAFAVHLPLSKDFHQLGGVGTRHSAALGLAELTDALCLVVSEERGGISVARSGELHELENPLALGAVLQEFRDTQQPAPKRRHLGIDLIRRNWLEKVASLLLVLGLWYLYVPGSRPAESTLNVPVSVINLPEGFVLDEVVPEAVGVTFRGPARAFYLYDRSAIAVMVDGSLAKAGKRTFQLVDQNVRHPADLSVENIQPATIKLSVRGATSPQGPPPDTGAPTAR